MFTKCPHCLTTFSVTEEQLSVANGRVRCGLCQELFEADKHLIIRASEQSSLRENPPPAIETPTPLPPENEADLLSEPVEPVASPGNYQSIAIPAILHNEVQQDHPEPKHWGLMLFTLVATSFLALQTTLYFKSRWIPDHLRTPACVWLPCQQELPRRDTSAIEILNRGVFSHPHVNGALMVTATLVNRARFSQPFPRVELLLLDINGEPVAGRQFEPQEYLVQTQDPATLMQAGQVVAFELEIEDPGHKVIGYEFSFL
jgi:predicted Zn finger-like uncharacterized protein